MSSNRIYDLVLAGLFVAACIVAGALAYLLVGDRFIASATPTPAPTAVPQDAWSRIQASGTMYVGTSADYPPFAFYSEEFQLDGLDIAIIRAIGERLGVAVDISDMSFDGLNWALELDQIDAAIAAISVTANRAANANFSDVYFLSEDAILARDDSQVGQITAVEQLAPYRVGVQRATVYSNWLFERLVTPNLMPATNLFAYERPEFALRDLRDGRIDVVVLDLAPAQLAQAQGGLKLVGSGLNTQHFAILLAQGDTALQEQINRVLRDMRNDGTLSALALQYVGVEVPLPPTIPTPDPAVPTPTPLPPTPPASCIDGMQFVSDLNLDDQNMTAPPTVAPGEAFRKGWRIRNTGTCTWDSSYALVFVNGNSAAAQMNGQPTPIQGSVPPGSNYDVYVDLIAPLTPGTYQAFWTMRNGQGRQFGDRVWVGIRVPAPATVTPLPTQTPSPNINFAVDRNNIFAGECVTFSWQTTGAAAVYFYPQGAPWQQNPVPTNGSRQECPPRTTTYELRVQRTDGRVEVRQITVFVEAVPGAPVIERFTVDPPYQIESGRCVDITWSVQGNVSSVRLTNDGASLWDNAPVSGTLQDCPDAAGQTVYVLEASGPGGSSRLQRTLSVVAPPPGPTNTPPPPQPATPIPPIIYTFGVNPTTIPVGSCVTVFWSAGGNVSNVMVRRNGDVLLDNAALADAVQDCPTTEGLVTYRLELAAEMGPVVAREAQVQVQASPAESPLANTSWALIGLEEEGLLPETVVTANFDSDGRIHGSGGCNSYSASYLTPGDDSISVGGLGASSTICPSPVGVMTQEQTYYTALATAARFEQLSDSLLVLYDPVGEEILRYVRN